jgi:hypothetical protein
MERDPIIEEIHAIREAFAKEHNFDLSAMFATLRRHQMESGRKVVSLAPRALSIDPLLPSDDNPLAQQRHAADGASRRR